jgi:signal transduction histidine kinase
LAAAALQTHAQQFGIFETITTRDGLVSNYVFCCAEDKDGYLWVGTDKGLTRYNGYKWDVWDVDNGLAGNYIPEIIADANGGIWFAVSEAGFYYFNPAKNIGITACSIKDADFIGLANIKCADSRHGCYFRPNSLQTNQVYHLKYNISSRKIESIIVPMPKVFSNLIVDEALSNKVNFKPVSVTQGIKRSGNYVTNACQVAFTDGNYSKLLDLPKLFNVPRYDFTIMAHDEQLFIANAGEDLICVDTFNDVVRYGLSSGLSSNNFSSLYKARDGSIYISTLGGGINVLLSSRRQKVFIDGQMQNRLFASATSGCAIGQKKLFVFLEEGSTVQEYKLPFDPLCVLEENGKFYIGSFSGVHIMQVRGNQLVQQQLVPNTGGISSILRHSGQLYASTFGSGMYRVDGKGMTRLKKNLPFANIEDCVPLGDKQFALLSHERGCCVVDEQFNLLYHVDKAHGLLSNYATCAYANNDTVFIGTKKGFSKFWNGKLIKKYSYSDGFMGNVCLAIGKQYNGYMLVVSDKMILNYEHAKLLPVAVTARSIAGSESVFAAKIIPSYSGALLLGRNYISILEIEDLIPHNSFSYPRFAGIVCDNQALDTNKHIVVPYDFKLLQLRFLPSDHLLFDRDIAMYKVAQSIWQPLSDSLTIDIRELRPGSYDLYIKTINANGLSSEARLIRTIKVKLPWWQQWWFYLLCASLVVGTIYVVFRARLRQKEQLYKQELKLQNELQQERLRISRDLHDNMGAYTTALISNVQSLRQLNADKEPLDRMQENASQIMSSLRETIWVLNNKDIDIIDLSDQFKGHCIKLLRNFDNIEFSSDEQIEEDVDLPAARAVHINNMLKEIVQNAIKHSGATQIKYSVSSAAGRVKFVVSDNGKGFDVAAKRSGNGMGNLQHRAKEANCICDVQSSSTGTEVSIVLL